MMLKSGLKICLFCILCAITHAIPQLVNAQTPNQYLLSKISGDILLYPNPVKSVLNIETNNKNIVDVKIDIYALDGRKIHTSEHKAEFGRVAADLSKLTKGLYVLILTIENTKTVHKILKD